MSISDNVTSEPVVSTSRLAHEFQAHGIKDERHRDGLRVNPAIMTLARDHIRWVVTVPSLKSLQ